MQADGLLDFLRGQPLLVLAMIAIFVTVMGGMVRKSVPIVGRVLQGMGNLGLVAALLFTIAQVARFTTTSDVALPQLGMPQQVVKGGETHIPMSGDGHFWLEASVNGTPQRFLVDTGATLTALSASAANSAKVQPSTMRSNVTMRTANGTIQAQIATISELRFGNIVARELDAAVAPGLGETNVIGMNLLSRLASWRVEGRTLILVPTNGHQPSE